MATKGDISDLEVLRYGGKPLVPLLNGFSGYKKTGVVESDIEGGASRQRKKYYGTTQIYNARFHLEGVRQQDYFRMFFEENVGKKFICHMVADRPILEPYVVQVIGEWEDSYRSMVDGQVTLTFEVFSVRDRSLDALLYGFYQSEGDDVNLIILALNELVEDYLK